MSKSSHSVLKENEERDVTPTFILWMKKPGTANLSNSWSPSQLVALLLCSGGHNNNNKNRKLCGLNNTYFLLFQRLRSPRTRCQQSQCLMSPVWGSYNYLLTALTWQKNTENSLSLSYEDANLIHEGPTPMTYSPLKSPTF